MIKRIFCATLIAHVLAYLIFFVISNVLIKAGIAYEASGTQGSTKIFNVLFVWAIYMLFGWALVATFLFIKFLSIGKQKIHTSLGLYLLVFIVFELSFWLINYADFSFLVPSLGQKQFPTPSVYVPGFIIPWAKDAFITTILRFVFTFVAAFIAFSLILTNRFNKLFQKK